MVVRESLSCPSGNAAQTAVCQEFREQFQNTHKFENHQHINGTLRMDEIT